MEAHDKICVHAWKSLYVTPLGEAGMCCIQFPLLTKINSQTDVKTIRQQKIWDDVRESMLKGEEHPYCTKCWNTEKENNLASYRQHTNEKYLKEYNTIKKQNTKKLLDDDLLYIDIRQTNICNMKCLSCNPVYSSLWGAEEGINYPLEYSDGNLYKDEIKKNGVLYVKNNEFEEYILSNLKNIREIYFAGGEPMLNTLHWDILQELDRMQRYDVKIYYNTNLFKLDYKTKHVFDYWNKFTTWFAGCSIDAIGSRAEYVRTGTKWKTIDAHLKLMQEKYPWNFDIDTTVSALSIGGLKDLMLYCEQLNIKKHRWGNTVIRPKHLSIDILPRDYRRHVFRDIEKLVQQKIKDNIEFEYLKSFLNHLEVAMLSTNATAKDRYKFKSFIEQKDKTRNTDIFASCPEFKDLWPKI